MTEDLAEFLTLRFYEDEHSARTAASWWPTGPDGDEVAGQLDRIEVGAFVHRFNSARVLAEVEAKRKILKEHRHDPVRLSEWEKTQPDVWPFGCVVCSPGYGPGPQPFGWCDTVKFLALPYADYPDYREEWRP